MEQPLIIGNSDLTDEMYILFGLDNTNTILLIELVVEKLRELKDEKDTQVGWRMSNTLDGPVECGIIKINGPSISTVTAIERFIEVVTRVIGIFARCPITVYIPILATGTIP